MERAMIDIHTHILPGVDDGSINTEESAAMINIMRRQGIVSIAATPHFYAAADKPTAFFERRRKAYDALRKETDLTGLDIRLGAEVLYFEGIAQMESIMEFAIEGSNLLLLEMPFKPWTNRMIRDVSNIASRPGLNVVLAHIDRYLAIQSENMLRSLLENPILVQANASAFVSLRTRNRLIKMLGKGEIDFIGSDCHHVTSRPPDMENAMKVIERKLGKEGSAECCKNMDAYWNQKLSIK